MRADLSQLHERLKGTLAAPLTAPEAAKLAESVRAVFNVNAQALLYLPTDGAPFSVRDWVSSTQRDGAILFVAARYVDLAICRQLLTLWLDLAVNTLMAMPITRDLKLWFLLDELGALHRLPALEAGLQTARNYGGAFVTGIHTFSKLKETYGDNVANSLSAVAKTKLILGASDPDSATWCSDIIGTGEVQDINEGHSFSANNARDGVSLSPDRREKKLVLPDQIRKLNPLHGYICFPGDLPTAPVRLTPVKRPIVAPAFLPRPGLDVRIPKAIRPPTDQSGGTSVPETTSPNRAGTAAQASAESGEGGRQSDPRQGTLDLPAPKLASAADPGSNASNVEALNRDGPTGLLGPVSGNPGPVSGTIPGASKSVDPATGQAAPALPNDPDAEANGGTKRSATRAPAGPAKSKSARPNSTPGHPATAQRELLDPPEGPTREPPDLGDFEIDL